MLGYGPKANGFGPHSDNPTSQELAGVTQLRPKTGRVVERPNPIRVKSLQTKTAPCRLNRELLLISERADQRGQPAFQQLESRPPQ